MNITVDWYSVCVCEVKVETRLLILFRSSLIYLSLN